MGLQIESGIGNSKMAAVNADNQLEVFAATEKHAAHISHDKGRTFSWSVEDAGPGAGEYTIYLQNDDPKYLVLDFALFNSTDNDVVWKIHKVTGTAATAAAITGVNLNLTSGNTASATCLGGAGGVTGLTSSAVMGAIFGGPGMSPVLLSFDGVVILGQNTAIALEYDAGTGGRVNITIAGHYHGY